MKLKALNGRIHTLDITKYKKSGAYVSRSKFQTDIKLGIKKVFSTFLVVEEFPIPGERLFLDFFIPEKMLAIEADGNQHDVYNSFFHKNLRNFINSQARDSRKEQWCELNNIRLIRVKPNDLGNLAKLIFKRA